MALPFSNTTRMPLSTLYSLNHNRHTTTASSTSSTQPDRHPYYTNNNTSSRHSNATASTSTNTSNASSSSTNDPAMTKLHSLATVATVLLQQYNDNRDVNHHGMSPTARVAVHRSSSSTTTYNHPHPHQNKENTHRDDDRRKLVPPPSPLHPSNLTIRRKLRDHHHCKNTRHPNDIPTAHHSSDVHWDVTRTDDDGGETIPYRNRWGAYIHPPPPQWNHPYSRFLPKIDPSQNDTNLHYPTTVSTSWNDRTLDENQHVEETAVKDEEVDYEAAKDDARMIEIFNDEDRNHVDCDDDPNRDYHTTEDDEKDTATERHQDEENKEMNDVCDASHNHSNDDDDDSSDDGRLDLDTVEPPAAVPTATVVATTPGTSRNTTKVATMATTIPYYMDYDWVPIITTGTSTTTTKPTVTTSTTMGQPLQPYQQVSPNTIRTQLQQYMKEHPQKRKTKLLQEFGVNSNSFRKFMDPSHYKDKWRAVENGTYWAAARYLEAERVHPHRSNPSVVLPPKPTVSITTTVPSTKTSNTPPSKKPTKSKKRKCSTSLPPRSNTVLCQNDRSLSPPPPPLRPPSGAPKRYKKSHREDAIQYMKSIMAVGILDTDHHDHGDAVHHRTQLIQQINAFLDFPGVSKSNFCAVALQGANRKSLDKIFQRNQGAGHYLTEDTFRRVYVFFEKKRIYDKELQGVNLDDQSDSDHIPDEAL